MIHHSFGGNKGKTVIKTEVVAEVMAVLSWSVAGCSDFLVPSYPMPCWQNALVCALPEQETH